MTNRSGYLRVGPLLQVGLVYNENHKGRELKSLHNDVKKSFTENFRFFC